MENTLMLKVACFLAVYLTRSLASGSRNESVEMGSSVTLHCTNSEIAWKDMIYVIWKINLGGKNCRVALAKNDLAHDSCEDGKKLIRTADGVYNLIIPNFTLQDEGNYICDVSYQSGGYVENIYVSSYANPDVTGWLETEKGHPVAVCTATSKPAASIHLETQDGKYFTNDTQTSKSNKGTYTVTSRFYLPQNGSNSNLTCVTSYLKDKVTRYNFPQSDNSSGWLFILLGVVATCIIVAVLTSLYIMREKLKQLRVFRKICCKPSIPTSTEGKNIQPSDPEDVQPYASYVQRVNSIYNSSAELFNA